MRKVDMDDEQLRQWLLDLLTRHEYLLDDDVRREARRAGISRGMLRRARALVQPDVRPHAYAWRLSRVVATAYTDDGEAY
jgi:hypothetical protein